jgi:hypothetical protein
VKNARDQDRNFSSGAGYEENREARRKYLIFRGLGRFFTVFHSFFTPCFSRKGLIFRGLGKTRGVNCAFLLFGDVSFRLAVSKTRGFLDVLEDGSYKWRFR